MGVQSSCLLTPNNLCNLLPKSAIEIALARNDFDALKQILENVLDKFPLDDDEEQSTRSRSVSPNGAIGSNSVSKLNRMYGEETLIQLAVKFQRVDVVELLLKLGANPDRTLKSSLSALTRSIIVNREDIFQVLINYGCDPNLSSDDGVTPLTYAVIVNRPFALTTLLAHPRIDLDSADVLGMTALHHACKCRNTFSVRFVEQLLAAGAKYELGDSLGASPLHLAVRSPQKVEIFCRHLSSKLGSQRLENALLSRDNNGLNPLHRALLKEEYESAARLIYYGSHFGVIPQVFSEQILTSALASNSPYILRHLLLSLPDPTCCYFSASISPPAGLSDMSISMRRFDVAARLARAACLPRSRQPRSKRISVLIAEGFNTPPSLQSFARLAIRRAIRTSNALKYETAVRRLDLPEEITLYLLYADIQFLPHSDMHLPLLASLVPDLGGLQRLDQEFHE